MIKISHAYENNLKNISVDIPKNKITTVIGVSGSGKSSLIYNVLATEAQRQEKIDRGHANCLDYAVRPKFESIENLPYCVTLKQRGLSQSISSTLATVSGLHELLRAEFTQYGEIIGDQGNVITEPSISDIKSYIQRYHPQSHVQLFAAVCDKKYTDGTIELRLLKENNITDAIFISSYDDKERLKKNIAVKTLNSQYQHTILIPFDRLDELDKYQALALENFRLKVDDVNLTLNVDFLDMKTGIIYQKKSTQLLSFNSSSEYSGKCQHCYGYGIIDDIDLDNLIVKHKPLSESFLNLAMNEKGGYKYISLYRDTIDNALKKATIDPCKTFDELSGDEKKVVTDLIFPKMIKHQEKPAIGKFIKPVVCQVCRGTRLNYKANAVKLFGLSISEILGKTIDDLYVFLQDKKIHHKKILMLLLSLKKSTLGYLPLERSTDTLSGGELQRLKFSVELNGDYRDLLYILDEPSSGLHPYNNHQMISLIQALRDKGNTVIISEHNQDYIQNSDHIIELGYESGRYGGEVVYSGKLNKSLENTFIRKKVDVNLSHSLELIGVNVNNIKDQNFIIPLHCLVAITGVSGSGKSSLIHDALIPTIKQYINDRSINQRLIKEVINIGKINAVVELTQAQIGLNSRSIVATYLNVFDGIRNIFASVEVANEFNFNKSDFSFNSSGGCETCKGLGVLDDHVCPSCLGGKYKPEILEIRFQGLTILDVLDKPISELLTFFSDDKLSFALQTLSKLGLSHLSLARETPTLSGGEAQRLKLSKTLIKSSKKMKAGGFLFVLDEPTTGLNEKDRIKIYAIFDEIIAHNNSIIIIEHNLSIIKNSDFIIDLGIGGGDLGGKKLFEGEFNELLKHKQSLTAKAFNGEYEVVKNIEIDVSNLKTKHYHNQNESSCHRFYLSGDHFDIEKKFYMNYKVITDSEQHKYFKEKNKLFQFVKSLTKYEIFFNPYVTDLFKYKIVPISIKKNKLKHLKKLGFKIGLKDFSVDEWQYRVKATDIEKAYNFGNGWITIVTKDKTYECFTRLISIGSEIIGMPKITEHSFNLYLNSCIYCHASGIKQSYDKHLIISDENKSILDDGFLHFQLNLKLKSIIIKFSKEGLFDFTLPFNQLSHHEKYIFLFGFKEYKFLKPKGKKTTLSDYVEWKGLYWLIYENLNKIDIEDIIRESKKEQSCPFCNHGFRPEIAHYTLNDMSMVDCLYENITGKAT